jgi:hypothetical protein
LNLGHRFRSLQPDPVDAFAGYSISSTFLNESPLNTIAAKLFTAP